MRRGKEDFASSHSKPEILERSFAMQCRSCCCAVAQLYSENA